MGRRKRRRQRRTLVSRVRKSIEDYLYRRAKKKYGKWALEKICKNEEEAKKYAKARNASMRPIWAYKAVGKKVYIKFVAKRKDFKFP